MWTSLASYILRYRLPILIILVVITAFMGWKAQDVRMSYKFGGLLPKDDPTSLAYADFIENFSEDGNVIVIGVEDEALYTIDNFSKWYELGQDVKKIQVYPELNSEGIPAIDSVFSIGQSYTIVRDDSLQQFDFQRIFSRMPRSQAELDSGLAIVRSLPFYEGLLYQNEDPSTLMMVFVNAALFNSENRGESVENILAKVDAFEVETGLKTHISGLPYIRTAMTTKVKGELKLFVLLAALVTAILLLLFFRNFGVMLVSMLVVGIGVVWSMGIIAMFDYPISMLMGLIPPLMIVIGVPNCIYLLNKYHAEYKKHGNKAKSLTRVIHKVGNATFLTNATTAMGFATFMFTHSDILKEFGVIASINILAVFVISLVTIPTIFSYLPPPKRKHVRHLDRKWVFHAVNKLVAIVTNKRKPVYVVTIILMLLGFYGISRVETTGNVVDDLPQDDRVITDLQWFESRFNGVMPFEVIIDTRRNGQVLKSRNLKRMEKMQTLLGEYEQFSKSLSIVDAVKFGKQAFYAGDPAKYALMNRQEQSFIGPYFQSEYETGGIEKTFMDEDRRRTRITSQVADIGTKEMAALLGELRPRIDSIFNPSAARVDSTFNAAKTPEELHAFLGEYETFADSAYNYLAASGAVKSACEDPLACLREVTDMVALNEAISNSIDATRTKVTLTGTSIVFLEGTSYMVKNLFISLLLAICVIAAIMALLFRSLRMVLISLVPNMIPLIFTASVMGYFGIAIKPSTILVFSIAFGISVDDTIHFLAKYRQELRNKAWNIRESVLLAVKETGVSMMYTSVVLFFGFGMFSASEFDGTRALGILVSMTLLVAMFSNLVVLPSLLLSFERWLTTKAFSEPFLVIIDEEEDIELEELEVRRGETGA
ncbi:MAG: MMPL family transporter [Flavobacteriales bacterium]|nr:MMPL family transporter [Flavobacteriales bacterium]MDG1781794.1 MMPL family transporter [Flavobacteriales bacterium]MDG2246034.1 MMPL family transporter [Flavobacteriales bacterium]